MFCHAIFQGYPTFCSGDLLFEVILLLGRLDETEILTKCDMMKLATESLVAKWPPSKCQKLWTAIEVDSINF